MLRNFVQKKNNVLCIFLNKYHFIDETHAARHLWWIIIFVPGAQQIGTEQIKRRWKQWCMDKLGIKATLYSLKHLNSTQVSAEIGTKAAARLNAHDENMLKSTYDVNGKDRELEAIKKVGNEL